MQNFKAFTTMMDPETTGSQIGEYEPLRVAHNSFARQEPFEFEEVAAKDGDDVFHFVSYVPFNGHLYELDGLQKGPISHGDVTDENWVSKARDAITKRIELYAGNEIKFNLMAVVGDKLDQAEKDLDLVKRQMNYLSKKCGMEDEDMEGLAELSA